jgi:hypothetical protein
MTFTPSDVFLVGVGGTGGYMSAPLARTIAYHPATTQNTRLTFIDGDEFEEKNMTRQLVGPAQLGQNKAQAMADLCSYQGLEDINTVEEFITFNTFAPLINNSKCPLVVCAVDNDATRAEVIKILDDLEDKDFFFITPGNSDGTEEVKGQAVWWGRINGENVGINPAKIYPNIKEPEDTIPRKGSCALLAPSRPQLIPANLMAATITLTVIQNLLDGVLDYTQSGMFFNLRTLKSSVS